MDHMGKDAGDAKLITPVETATIPIRRMVLAWELIRQRSSRAAARG